MSLRSHSTGFPDGWLDTLVLLFFCASADPIKASSSRTKHWMRNNELILNILPPHSNRDIIIYFSQILKSLVCPENLPDNFEPPRPRAFLHVHIYHQCQVPTPSYCR